MGFFLYQTRKTEQGSTNYERVGSEEVELGGRDGPIATFARNHASSEMPHWHLSETDLLKHFLGSPDTHAVVIDLKPRAKRKISLYRSRDIWGYSKNGWTPILLRLQALYSLRLQDGNRGRKGCRHGNAGGLVGPEQSALTAGSPIFQRHSGCHT